jgi:hypothetical protein
MAEKKGLLIICDRCGDTGFCECIGEGEADGGFTRWNKFEQPPEGWVFAMDCEKFNRLCPDCYKEYSNMIRKFEESQPIKIRRKEV